MRAISICYVDRFEEELKKAKSYEDRIKYASAESKFNLILNEIFEDFREITDAKTEMLRFIAIVRWCKGKQMMVQALNIIESNITKALVEFDSNQEEKLVNITRLPAFAENKKFIDDEVRDSYLTEDQYLYRQLLLQIVKEYSDLELSVDLLLKELKNLSTKSNSK